MKFVVLWGMTCVALGVARADWSVVPVCGLIGIVLHQFMEWPQLAFDMRLGRLEWMRGLVWCYVSRCAFAGGLMGMGWLGITIATLP